MQELSRRPRERVLGTGTMLDTARLRALLAHHFAVGPRSVHAYVLGEHGDSELVAWSSATIAGVPLRSAPGFEASRMQAIFEQVRTAAYAIIERKGYTSLAIGVVLASLVDAILRGEQAVLPVSLRLQGEFGLPDTCLSLPATVGRHGLGPRWLPPLDDEELEGLRRSASVLHEHTRALRLA
jgi:L-lactate dehydrogenase